MCASMLAVQVQARAGKQANATLLAVHKPLGSTHVLSETQNHAHKGCELGSNLTCSRTNCCCCACWHTAGGGTAGPKRLLSTGAGLFSCVLRWKGISSQWLCLGLQLDDPSTSARLHVLLLRWLLAQSWGWDQWPRVRALTRSAIVTACLHAPTCGAAPTAVGAVAAVWCSPPGKAGARESS